MTPRPAGLIGSAVYLACGALWVAAAHPPGTTWLYLLWILLVACVGAVLPGVANQVSMSRAYLAAPALAYSISPGGLGVLAVVVAVAGLSDLVDGTIARRFDHPSNLGGGLDPVVDGLFLGALAAGLAIGGAFPLWLAAVVIARYLLPAAVGAFLLMRGRRPELRHTFSGQVSTALILVLLGGLALFRYFGQDARNVVIGAEVVIPVATAATLVHLAYAAKRSPAAGAG